MSRSVGDQVAHAVGVSSEPDCGVRRLSPDDKFLVAATDGLWEFLPNAEVVARVAEVSSRSGSPRAASTIFPRGRPQRGGSRTSASSTTRPCASRSSRRRLLISAQKGRYLVREHRCETAARPGPFADSASAARQHELPDARTSPDAMNAASARALVVRSDFFRQRLCLWIIARVGVEFVVDLAAREGQ